MKPNKEFIGKAAYVIAYVIMVISVSKIVLFMFAGAVVAYSLAITYLYDQGALTEHTSDVINYTMAWLKFYVLMAVTSVISYRCLRKEAWKKTGDTE